MQAAQYIEYDSSFGEEEEQAKVMEVSCSLNNVICKLKLKNYKQAETMCTPKARGYMQSETSEGHRLEVGGSELSWFLTSYWELNIPWRVGVV
ncbi:hypothetical protein AAG906_027072 [Vitis piasezkii]